MRSARIQGKSDIYHVVSRGVGQQIIFETDADRRRYLESLERLVGESSCTLLAWCLMDNHVHLLVCCPLDSLSAMMRRLNSGYALYFNLVHGRSGHLFQGRFLSEPVDSDEYLFTVIRYIHQNPIKAGITEGCSYAWSSYDAYAEGEALAGTELVLGAFGGREGFVAAHEVIDEEARCLDVRRPRLRVDDDSAKSIAIGLFGDSGLGQIKALPRERRDEALRQLKEQRLTTRQIQRLTGVSLGVISKA